MFGARKAIRFLPRFRARNALPAVSAGIPFLCRFRAGNALTAWGWGRGLEVGFLVLYDVSREGPSYQTDHSNSTLAGTGLLFTSIIHTSHGQVASNSGYIYRGGGQRERERENVPFMIVSHQVLFTPPRTLDPVVPALHHEKGIERGGFRCAFLFFIFEANV